MEIQLENARICPGKNSNNKGFIFPLWFLKPIYGLPKQVFWEKKKNEVGNELLDFDLRGELSRFFCYFLSVSSKFTC